ncbi:MAG: four helix bundle protein [bacterium]|nr:four helix bundle protein [bacterium]
MDPFDIPLFQNVYDFYKTLYLCLKDFPRQDRYSLGQRCEVLTIELLQSIAIAGRLLKLQKAPYLEKASTTVDLLRVALRLAKDVHALDMKKYVTLQAAVDAIGRMLGGWRRSVLA